MKQTIIIFLLLLAAHPTYPQSYGIRQKNFNVKKNIALQGYDPVSYFDSKPQEGDNQYSVAYKGITYLFANVTNLNKFKTTPDKYEPAYGGWCAYAMGDSGEKVKVDPETYKIKDNRLYLFYNFWGTNTLESWNKNEKVLLPKGDQNWKKIIP